MQSAHEGIDVVTSDEEVKVVQGFRCEIVYLIRLFIQVFLVFLFLASFAVQFNDAADVIAWIIFYFAQAVLAFGMAVYLTYPQKYFDCYSRQRGLAQMAGSLAIWSLVLVVIASIDMAKTPSGGEEEGGDNDSATKREEIAYELGGAMLGLVAALIPLITMVRRMRKDSQCKASATIDPPSEGDAVL
jgi:hypothetical protein